MLSLAALCHKGPRRLPSSLLVVLKVGTLNLARVVRLLLTWIFLLRQAQEVPRLASVEVSAWPPGHHIPPGGGSVAPLYPLNSPLPSTVPTPSTLLAPRLSLPLSSPFARDQPSRHPAWFAIGYVHRLGAGSLISTRPFLANLVPVQL